VTLEVSQSASRSVIPATVFVGRRTAQIAAERMRKARVGTILEDVPEPVSQAREYLTRNATDGR
jgi:hypothetical protein